ncbi:putative fic doc family protein [Daldinia childiae]|uniref:putative fic doc family protein n=1 Tax=Daldinia childiae TaxID=326645 RepID=UPI0014464F0D|nr:putative fic doc family protein [Daldinia childiae]KAF3063813.1 putative fic doc family protein [Daldinia childiae]
MISKLIASTSEGWPRWLSIRGNSEIIDFTIRTSHYLREEITKRKFPADPALIIQLTRDKSTTITEESGELGTTIEDSLIELVYSSNFIEVTGSDFDVTEKLCRAIFRGQEVQAEVEPNSPEYEQARAALIALKRPNSPEEIVRSRQEVINHAKALNYAIDHIILNSEPVTEDFLREVHGILGAGKVLGEDAGRPGEYRTWEIAARHGQDMKKKSIFIRASTVPTYMKELVGDLHKDMIAAEENGTIDPFDMASRYCHRLVCIHPFGDGNGRMCRILLNMILLKYAGFVSTFGGTEDERQEYLDIAKRANKKFHEEDMEVPEEDKKGHRELAKFMLRTSKKTLGKLWAWATD